jgi:Ca2+-binding EF-hand superfamily protein
VNRVEEVNSICNCSSINKPKSVICIIKSMLTLQSCTKSIISLTLQRPNTTFFVLQGDIHGTDTLDCEEFVTVLLHIKKMSNDEYLPKAFEFFDKDGNGFIEMSELMETLGDGELKPDEQLVNDIIQEVDKDKVSTQ